MTAPPWFFLCNCLIKPFDHFHSSTEQLFICGALLRPADQHTIQAKSLGAPIFLIFQIGVVNDLCNHGHFRISNCELFAQGSKGAVISPMTEAACLKHIE